MSITLELSRDSLYAALFHLSPRLANVILFIIIGHRHGPVEAGIFGLAITYLLILTTIMRGMDDLLVRQVSREPSRAGGYLIYFGLLRLALSILLYVILMVVVTGVFDYGRQTTLFLLIFTISLVPDALSFVGQSILLGHRRFGAPAAIALSAGVLKALLGGIILFSSGTLSYLAWASVASSCVGLALTAFALKRRVSLASARTGEWRQLREHSRTVLFFIAITALAAFESQADTVLLSGYHGEAEVGWYNAATTVAYSLILFSQAYRFAVYPVMSRFAKDSWDRFARLYQQSIRLLGMTVMPMVAGVVVIAPALVRFLFGIDFEPSVDVLETLGFALIFIFLSEPNVRAMLACDRQKVLTIILLATVGLNISLNILLIPDHGAWGAALSRLASSFIYFLFTLAYVRLKIVRVKLLRVVTWPLVASALMGAILWPVRTWPLLLTIGGGFLLYTSFLVLSGGVNKQEILTVKRMMQHSLKRG